MIEAVTDQVRQQASQVSRATVLAVDLENAKVQVEVEDRGSAWLPWIVPRAKGVRHWSPPQVGESVLMLCPGGEPEQGVVLPSFYQLDFPAPETNPREHVVYYEDGAVIGYNDENHHLHATLPEGGTTELFSDGGITLTGDLTVNGNVIHNGNTQIKGTTHSTGTVSTDSDVTASGNMAASGNVSDSGGSLQANRDTFNSHTHPGDSGGTTGPPNQQQ